MPEETQETTNESALATRDELLAAVAAEKAAGGTDETAPTEPVAAPVEGEPPAAAAPVEPDPDAKLAEILKRREEGHAKRRDAEAYADQIRRQADAEKQRLIEEARAEAKRTADAELADLRAKFRASPTETLRALGSPDEITDAVMREGTPEARALAKAQEEARLAREEAREGKTAREELSQMRQEIQQERHAAVRAQTMNEYLSAHASQEKAPYMHARWDADEIFERSVSIAKTWAADGLVYKKDFDDGDVAMYLERQSKERFTKTVPTAAQQVSAAGSATSQGVATKVTANGTRTLAASAGSERRTSPRPFNEMNADEQRQALIDEAQAARKANPDATM